MDHTKVMVPSGNLVKSMFAMVLNSTNTTDMSQQCSILTSSVVGDPEMDLSLLLNNAHPTEENVATPTDQVPQASSPALLWLLLLLSSPISEHLIT